MSNQWNNQCSSGSGGWVKGRGARRIKCMQPLLASNFLWPIFTGSWAVHGPLLSPIFYWNGQIFSQSDWENNYCLQCPLYLLLALSGTQCRLKEYIEGNFFILEWEGQNFQCAGLFTVKTRPDFEDTQTFLLKSRAIISWDNWVFEAGNKYRDWLLVAFSSRKSASKHRMHICYNINT